MSSPENEKRLKEFVLDTEFNDEVGDCRIEPISIGMVSVADESKTFYRVSSEFNQQAAEKRGFLLREVLPKLGKREDFLTLDEIREELKSYLVSEIVPSRSNHIKIWARCGAMDQAVLSLIFGGYAKFSGFMQEIGVVRTYFHDTNELRERAGFPYLKDLRRDWDIHHALKDAIAERRELLQLQEMLR